MKRIDHVNLVVGNLDAMAGFYRDTLGLGITKRITIGGPWIEAITGLKDAEADVIYLAPASGPGVELICYRTPRASRPERLGEANTPGLRHVAFTVDDLEGLVQKLKAANAQVLSDVQEVPLDQVEFGGRQKRIVYCRDPEGNLLELCTTNLKDR